MEPIRLFDLGGVIAAFGLGVAFVTASARNVLSLYRAEPLPDPAVGESRAA